MSPRGGSVAEAPSSLAVSDPRETWPPHRGGDRPRGTAAGISVGRSGPRRWEVCEAHSRAQLITCLDAAESHGGHEN